MWLLVSVLPEPVKAQVSGSNLLEAQIGNYPHRRPSNRQDLYDQLNLEYGFSSGRLGLRFETDRNSQQKNDYEGLSQRYVDWTDDRYRVRVGNFYTILGRGLIHRSFELTGVVLDELGIRSRFGPSRDVDGVLAEADAGPVGVLLFSGSPSSGETSLAPAHDMPRHSGQLSGAQLSATVYRQAKLGAAYLRTTAGFGQQELGSGFVDVDPLGVLGVQGVALPIYVEYARADGSVGDWWRFKTADRVPHALYCGANLLSGSLGLSVEWKDYAQFRLGTNDPPSLVREHSATLLNRSTHVLDADREEGYQIEGSYAASEWASFLVNVSRADGAMASRFEERYVEIHSAPKAGQRWESTLFYDQGKDETFAISDRRTYGLNTTVRFIERWSSAVDVQRQAASYRIGASSQPFENLFMSFKVARAEIGSAAVVWERTSDPLDPSRFDPGNKHLHFVAGVFNATLTPRHDATLFVGRRRGGRACTAGTCYEVQPFVGAELRLTSRF